MENPQISQMNLTTIAVEKDIVHIGPIHLLSSFYYQIRSSDPLRGRNIFISCGINRLVNRFLSSCGGLFLNLLSIGSMFSNNHKKLNI